MEETVGEHNLLCSACYTPCPAAEAHVVPRWNPELRKVITAYRCGSCWLPSLAELRAVLRAGDGEVQQSFCDFLGRRGYERDAETLRSWPAGERLTGLLRIVDAVEDSTLVFDP